MAVKLTARTIENMQPKAARIEVPDTLLTGLYLVVQPSGAKSWAVRYRHDGKPRKFTLGRYPALDLAAAREQGKAALRRAAEGEDPAGDRQERDRTQAEAATEAKRRQRDKFDAVAALFIEKHAKARNRTWQETEAIIRRNVLPEWADRDIADIRRRDVVDMLDKVAGRAPVQANRTLAAVRKLFNWAVARGIVEASPCAGVERPAPEKSRDRILTDDELRAVWRASDVLGWPFGPAVKLLILTGQRRDEVGQMAWSEVDLDGRTWTIPRERSKNDQSQEVWLSDPALDLLKAMPRFSGSDLIFTTNGRSAASGYSKAKSRLDDLSGVEGWRLHDIRRTVASGMARIGIGLPAIEKILNHRSGTFGGIVGVYQRHTFTDEKRKALEAWAGFVGGLLEPRAANVVTLRGQA